MPLDDLFVALQFPPHIGKRLNAHFTSKGVQELSLVEFMDFLIPDGVKITSLYGSIPAYQVKGIAQIYYANFIKGMNKIEDDLGVAFKNEWTRRKKRLKESLIAIKYPAPYLMRGKNPVL